MPDVDNDYTDAIYAKEAVVVGLADRFGFEGQFSPMRDFKVAEPFRLVGTTFGASIDTNFWTASNSGAGSAAGVANSIATVTSGTANSGYGKMTTARTARFQFAHPLLFRGAFRITEKVVPLCTRRFGAISTSTVTPTDGAYFEIDASGVLSVNSVSNGAIAKVESGAFNGKATSYTIDTNVHAYEIIYYTMGAWFYVDNNLIHKFTPTTSILYRDLNVPITITSVNTAGGVTSGSIECWNATILRLGRDLTSPASKYQAGTTAGVVLKLGAGLIHGLAISGVVNNSVITLYDNTAASGTILWSSGTMGSQTTPFNVSFEKGIPFYTGCTMVISGANSNVTITYE